MAGFTDAYELVVLNAQFADTDKIAFSENGSSESANLGKMNVTGWANASAGAKSNAGALQSPVALGPCTITHFAVFASDGITQKTDWTALTASRTLAANDKLEFAIGAIVVTLD